MEMPPAPAAGSMEMDVVVVVLVLVSESVLVPVVVWPVGVPAAVSVVSEAVGVAVLEAVVSVLDVSSNPDSRAGNLPYLHAYPMCHCWQVSPHKVSMAKPSKTSPAARQRTKRRR